MRKQLAIGLSIIITAAIWANSLSANREINISGDTVVLHAGEDHVDVSEAMIFFLERRNQIESKWGAEMWKAKVSTDAEGNDITYEEEVKEDLKEEIALEANLIQLAKEKGITLSEQEEEMAKRQAVKAMERFPSEDLISYEITEDKVAEYYNHKLLVKKLYDVFVGEQETDKKIEDYRRVEIYAVMFPTIKRDQAGEVTELSESNKDKVKKLAYDVYDRTQLGEDLEQVVEEYDLPYAGERTIALSAIPKSYEHIADQLEDGEVSNVITMDNGYMIVKMLQNYDEEKTKEAYEAAIEKEQEESFMEIYEEKYKKGYKNKWEEDVWKKLPLASKS